MGETDDLTGPEDAGDLQIAASVVSGRTVTPHTGPADDAPLEPSMYRKRTQCRNVLFLVKTMAIP